MHQHTHPRRDSSGTGEDGKPTLVHTSLLYPDRPRCCGPHMCCGAPCANNCFCCAGTCYCSVCSIKCPYPGGCTIGCCAQQQSLPWCFGEGF